MEFKKKFNRGKPGIGTVLTQELISVLNQVSDDLHGSGF